MSGTDLVVRPDDDARVVRLQDARGQTHTAPRIVQYVNAETADHLLILCDHQPRPALAVVALDDAGRTWSLETIPDTSPAETERGRVIWRRLWVPPLPNGDGDA